MANSLPPLPTLGQAHSSLRVPVYSSSRSLCPSTQGPQDEDRSFQPCSAPVACPQPPRTILVHSCAHGPALSSGSCCPGWSGEETPGGKSLDEPWVLPRDDKLRMGRGGGRSEGRSLANPRPLLRFQCPTPQQGGATPRLKLAHERGWVLKNCPSIHCLPTSVLGPSLWGRPSLHSGE